MANESAPKPNKVLILQNNANCWEYFKCGREPGGKNIESQGHCPAANEKKYNTINHGKNGGRFCWFVKGTMCKGNFEGNFIDSFEHCQKCEFFLLVQKQENRHLVVVRNDLL